MVVTGVLPLHVSNFYLDNVMHILNFSFNHWHLNQYFSSPNGFPESQNHILITHQLSHRHLKLNKQNSLSYLTNLHFSVELMTTCGLNQKSGNEFNPITLPSSPPHIQSSQNLIEFLSPNCALNMVLWPWFIFCLT